jgi:N-acetylmuramic acid 6-phosphate etherase
MAVLDAAEIPPTFGVPHEAIRAFIAGGRQAVTGAVEGAEDAAQAGVAALRGARVGKGDVVVGIAASGTTPYVLAAINYARRRGATTIAITSNEHMPLAQRAEIAISVEIGPEVLTGSTRLKAGTAQKMVLNMLSTAAMVKLGHVYENLMIDAVLTNEKLHGRAVRILMEASGASVSAAEDALRAAGHSMRVGLVMLKLGVDAREARKRLSEARGNLRKTLGE